MMKSKIVGRILFVEERETISRGVVFQVTLTTSIPAVSIVKEQVLYTTDSSVARRLKQYLVPELASKNTRGKAAARRGMLMEFVCYGKPLEQKVERIDEDHMPPGVFLSYREMAQDESSDSDSGRKGSLERGVASH